MGRVKDLMIDYCELSGDFEESMDRLMADDQTAQSEFAAFLQVRRIVATISTATGERRLVWATRLWNAIDCMERPEACWNLMLQELPDVFYGPSPNCMMFTY